MVTVTQTHTVPYVTYHWVPVTMSSASVATAGFSTLAGSSFAGLPAGVGPIGLPGAASAFPLPPASFPALAPPAIPSAAAPPSLEGELVRALLARLATAAVEKTRAAVCSTADNPAKSDSLAEQKKLKAAIVALDARLDLEIEQLRNEMVDSLSVLVKEVNRLDQKIEQVRKEAGKGKSEPEPGKRKMKKVEED
jgi:hypothetical protein